MKIQKLRLIVCISVIFAVAKLNAQFHWENLIMASDTFSYLAATSEPPQNWYSINFNDSSWAKDIGGFGYGDDDDSTLVSENTQSVYLRKKFNINNKSLISNFILDIDFDDGFVAYLNGTEVARSTNIPAGTPTYNTSLPGDNEALLKDGGVPDRFKLERSSFIEGENTLAVHILNRDSTSSDLSGLVFINLKINADHTVYNELPDWFIEPFIFSESYLPIVMINTNGQQIIDDPKTKATMGVIDNGAGSLNHIDHPFNNYHGYIAIELRGESSLDAQKKSYRLETQKLDGENRNTMLLGMPEENDWIFYGPYIDKSLIRNSTLFYLNNLTGQYGSRIRFFELVINNEYHGVYVLMEKIKVDDNRVDIAKLKPEDTSGDQLTGGYLLRVDKIDSGTSTFTTGYSYPNKMEVKLQYYDPDQSELAPSQKEYIINFFKDFEATLLDENFDNPNDGYNKYVDVGSFIDFMLVSEIGLEVDKYKYSTYFYKEKDSDGGKLFAGPQWDMDRAFGNDVHWEYGQMGDVWQYNYLTDRIYWWQRMMEDPYFADLLNTRWKSLRTNAFSDENIQHYLDSITKLLEEPQQRNFLKWPVLGVQLYQNTFVGDTYEEEIEYLTNWILNRLEWLDANISGNILDPIVHISIDNYDVKNRKLWLDINMSDEYFSREQLKKKHFKLNNEGEQITKDTVIFIDASSAKLYLNFTSPELNIPDNFSVTINEKTINGYNDITSNTLGFTGINPIFSNIKTQVFANHNNIVVKCDYPELLPETMEVFNLSGQKIAVFNLEKTYTNIIETNLSTNIYFVRLVVNHIPKSFKLILNN